MMKLTLAIMTAVLLTAPPVLATSAPAKSENLKLVQAQAAPAPTGETAGPRHQRCRTVITTMHIDFKKIKRKERVCHTD